MVQRMIKRKNETMVSLKLDTYRAEQLLAKAESDKYEQLQKAAKPLEIAPLAVDLRQLSSDTVQVNRASRFTRNLKKDITLREAVAVIKDQI
jgi:carboxyl-terminal processing protease